MIVWALFGIAFPWDWNENWPFPVLWQLLSFPNLLAYECSTSTASSFRIWNSLSGILSPPLSLFVVMLPKAHLTLHSSMSGSRWVTRLCGCLGHWDLLRIVLLCILATSSWYLLFLLGPYLFCPLSSPSLHEMFLWYLWFSLVSLIFPSRLLQNIENSSLCYIVGPCWLPSLILREIIKYRIATNFTQWKNKIYKYFPKLVRKKELCWIECTF